MNNDIPARLEQSTEVTEESTGLLGDDVSLASGALGFHATDVSLPGNSELAVAIHRRFSAAPESIYGEYNFGDWQLDVPRIETAMIAGFGDWSAGRECSGDLNPHEAWWNGVLLNAWTYWNGVTLIVPGKTESKVLKNWGNVVSSAAAPLITKDNWKISCITRTDSQGRVVGEGFKVVSPKGITYRMTQPHSIRRSPLSAAPNAPYVTAQLRVTQVSDRFGNTVIANGFMTWAILPKQRIKTLI